jgi:ERCC4-type nuclease
MANSENSEFTVIIDTREQQPWDFPYHTVANRKLDTGDYSIEGLEHLLCIERKKGIAEIANNITEKRFKDVIERMAGYKYAFILIECDYDQLMNYPIGSDVPQKLWKNIKIQPAYILKYLVELQLYYGIHVIFCGCPSWAEKTAMSIMKRIYTKHGQDQQKDI